MGHSRPLFLYFCIFGIFVVQLVDNILPITGFKLRISGIGSNRSANWATTTALCEENTWVCTLARSMTSRLCFSQRKAGFIFSIKIETYSCLIFRFGESSVDLLHELFAEQAVDRLGGTWCGKCKVSMNSDLFHMLRHLRVFSNHRVFLLVTEIFVVACLIHSNSDACWRFRLLYFMP